MAGLGTGRPHLPKVNNVALPVANHIRVKYNVAVAAVKLTVFLLTRFNGFAERLERRRAIYFRVKAWEVDLTPTQARVGTRFDHFRQQGCSEKSHHGSLAVSPPRGTESWGFRTVGVYNMFSCLF